MAYPPPISHDIGVDGANLAGEGGPDRVGAGVAWHAEPSGRIHDPAIMARPGTERPLRPGRTAACEVSLRT